MIPEGLASLRGLQNEYKIRAEMSSSEHLSPNTYTPNTRLNSGMLWSFYPSLISGLLFQLDYKFLRRQVDSLL